MDFSSMWRYSCWRFVRNKLSFIYFMSDGTKRINWSLFLRRFTHALIKWIMFHVNAIFYFIITLYFKIYLGAGHSNTIQILYVRSLSSHARYYRNKSVKPIAWRTVLRPFRTIIKAERRILSEWYEIPRCNVAHARRSHHATIDVHIRMKTGCTFISLIPSVTITATRRPP